MMMQSQKNACSKKPATSFNRGFSLIELMVSIVIGLIIIAALSTVFVGNMRTRNEIEKANQQIENGRYAIQLLSEDIRLAGYLAELDPTLMVSPASLPDVCATAESDLQANLMLHVQGYNNGGSTLGCISDLKTDTDVIVIRRVSSCAVGTAGCDGVIAGVPYFQASLCSNNTELNFSTNPADYLNHRFKLTATVADLNLRKRDCATTAATYRFRTHIYFVANNNESGDGIPTLKRAELGVNGFSIVPLVEGIENLQIEYGMDDTTIDGAPESYTATPANVEKWRAVVSAKIALLARNTEKTTGYTDTKTYTLLSDTIPSFNDSYKRHAFQTTVRLNNPSGRRAP